MAVILERFEKEGIDVLVFVPPHNLEHIATLDIEYEPGLASTLQAIERVVENHGSRLLDYHAVAPDGAFRDELDHTHGGLGPGQLGWLARSLAEEVRVLRRESLRRRADTL